jgi:hypothetical protein
VTGFSDQSGGKSNSFRKKEKKKKKNTREIFVRFDCGNCNNGGLVVPKSKRGGRQDRRKLAFPRTNLIRLG